MVAAFEAVPAGVGCGQSGAAVSAGIGGHCGLPTVSVDDLHMGHLIGCVQVFLGPDDDGVEDGQRVLPFGGKHVFLASTGAVLVGALGKESGVEQPSQALAEHIVGYFEALLDGVKASVAEEDLAKDQAPPRITQDIQATGKAARAGRPV